MPAATPWAAYQGTVAEAYDRYLVPAIFATWADGLVASAMVRPGELVLDLAAGTGAVARSVRAVLSGRGRVVGLDASAQMLAIARRHAPDLELVLADASLIPFANGSFNAVLCQQAFQFFPDNRAVLGEIRRVLSPEGRAMVAVWRGLDAAPAFAALAGAIERHVGPEAADTRFLGPSEAGELEANALAASFDAVEVSVARGVVRFASARDFVDHFPLGAPTLIKHLRHASAAQYDAILDEVTQMLAGYIVAGSLVVPMEANVLMLRKGRAPDSL